MFYQIVYIVLVNGKRYTWRMSTYIYYATLTAWL